MLNYLVSPNLTAASHKSLLPSLVQLSINFGRKKILDFKSNHFKNNKNFNDGLNLMPRWWCYISRHYNSKPLGTAFGHYSFSDLFIHSILRDASQTLETETKMENNSLSDLWRDHFVTCVISKNKYSICMNMNQVRAHTYNQVQKLRLGVCCPLPPKTML